MVDFHDGGCDVLCRGSVAGAVVGTGEVIIDCLGNAHYTAFIAVFEHEFGDLVAGVH